MAEKKATFEGPSLNIPASYLKRLADSLSNPEALPAELQAIASMLTLNPTRAKDVQSFLSGWIQCAVVHGFLKVKGAEPPMN
jgi:hypothetical protein